MQSENRENSSAIVPKGIQVAAGWSWRFLAIVAAAALLIYGLIQVADIVIPAMLAILLTVLIRPIALWLQRKTRWNIHVSGLVAMLGVLLVIVGLLFLAVRQLIKGFPEVRDQALTGIDQVATWLQNGPLHITDAQYTEVADKLTAGLSSNAGKLATGALNVTGTTASMLAGVAITLFTTYFFVTEGPSIWRWIMRLMPKDSRQITHEAFRRGWKSLGAYVQTQIVVAGVDAIGISAGALILGLPFVVPIGLIVFFGSFVPIVGALVTGALAVLVALVVKGPVYALIMLAIILLVQQVEGHILQPFLMGKAVSLHPVAVLLGVIAGTSVGGVIGAMFAVPAIALINSVVLFWAGRDQFPALGHDSLTAHPAGLGTSVRGESADEVVADVVALEAVDTHTGKDSHPGKSAKS